MNTTLSKLLALGMFSLCCHSSLANTVIQPSVSNPFQVAQSDPNDNVADNCPKIPKDDARDPYYFHTQKAIDDFSAKYPNCTQVPYLFVSGEDINNLDGFDNIQSITSGADNGVGLLIGALTKGNEWKSSNQSLTTLSGLDKLQNVKGDIVISSNDNLESIDALNNVETVVGNILIEKNSKLLGVHAFSNKLKGITGSLFFTTNLNVSDFSDSFSHLETIDGINEGLYLYSSASPKFERLTKISGGLYFSRLQYKDFSELGLDSLNYVGTQIVIQNNFYLESLKGLQGIKSLGQAIEPDSSDLLSFDNNPNLTDCSALKQIYDPKRKHDYSIFDYPQFKCKLTLEGKQ